jgi:hypothetical protein
LNPQAPPNNLIFLQIHLVSNTNESVTFNVNPFLSPERILSYIITKQYWLQAEGANKRKTFFGSFSRGSSSSIKSNPRFVERSRDFHRELTKLLAILGYTPESPITTSASTPNSSVSSSPSYDEPLSTASSFDLTDGSPNASPPSSNPIYEQFGKRAEPAAASSTAVLKALSFSRKTVRGAYDHSISYVPIANQMDSHIYKISILPLPLPPPLPASHLYSLSTSLSISPSISLSISLYLLPLLPLSSPLQITQSISNNKKNK